MKHNIFTRIIEKSAFLFVLLSMSVLPVLTSCQMQISDDDEVEYVDQSGMRPRDDSEESDRALKDVGKWVKGKASSVWNFFRHPKDLDNKNIEGWRSRVKNTVDIQKIMKGYSGALSYAAGLVGSGDSYMSGVGARALMKAANILDGFLNDWSLGLFGLVCDIFIPTGPDKEQMRFNAIMNQFAIQSSQIDELSDQLMNAKQDIIDKITDQHAYDRLNKRYAALVALSKKVPDGGYKTYLEGCSSGEFMSYENYKTFFKSYSQGEADYKLFEDVLCLTDDFKSHTFLDDYKDYAKDNSCWSWQYNQYMDYFYGIESTAFFKNYGIVEQLWSPYIYCGNDSNKNPNVVPNINWELYTFLNWFHNYHKDDDSILKYVKNNFESHISDNTFYLEISQDEYQENQKMYEEAERNSALTITQDPDSENYRLQYDVTKATAAEQLWYILNYLSRKSSIVKVKSETGGTERIRIDGAGDFEGNFVEDFFAADTGIMFMGSTKDSPELTSIINSNKYGPIASLYLQARNDAYLAWESFESDAGKYMDLLNNLNKIKDKEGTITCLVTGKVYAVQLGRYADLQANFFKLSDNDYYYYHKVYPNAVIQAPIQGYCGFGGEAGYRDDANEPVAYIYDKIFHGMSVASVLTKLDSNIVENYKQKGMLELNVNRNSNTSRNGMLVYPSKDDYEKIIRFYNGRSVVKTNIVFRIVQTSDGKDSGYWEVAKKNPPDKSATYVSYNPTLAEILLYDAGMGPDYVRAMETETVKDNNGNDQINSYPAYHTCSAGDEKNINYLMAEGLNPRADYFNQGVVADDGSNKKMIVFEHNMGFDSWKENTFSCAIGYYAIKADKSLGVFFSNGSFEYYNARNFGLTDNLGVAGIWTFYKAQTTLTPYSSSKKDNPTLYFPVEVGDFNVSSIYE